MEKCPRCSDVAHKLTGLSRVDNKTRICVNCQRNEYFRAMNGKNVWPNYPRKVLI